MKSLQISSSFQSNDFFSEQIPFFSFRFCLEMLWEGSLNQSILTENFEQLSSKFHRKQKWKIFCFFSFGFANKMFVKCCVSEFFFCCAFFLPCLIVSSLSEFALIPMCCFLLAFASTYFISPLMAEFLLLVVVAPSSNNCEMVNDERSVSNPSVKSWSVLCRLTDQKCSQG